VGFLEDKVALGQVFSEYFGFLKPPTNKVDSRQHHPTPETKKTTYLF
jgi:hypothetical protein